MRTMRRCTLGLALIASSALMLSANAQKLYLLDSTNQDAPPNHIGSWVSHVNNKGVATGAYVRSNSWGDPLFYWAFRWITSENLVELLSRNRNPEQLGTYGTRISEDSKVVMVYEGTLGVFGSGYAWRSSGNFSLGGSECYSFDLSPDGLVRIGSDTYTLIDGVHQYQLVLRHTGNSNLAAALGVPGTVGITNYRHVSWNSGFTIIGNELRAVCTALPLLQNTSVRSAFLCKANFNPQNFSFTNPQWIILPDLSLTIRQTVASEISLDGRWAVGYSQTTIGDRQVWRAVFWDLARGTQAYRLPLPQEQDDDPQTQSYAYQVSQDGSVIAGSMSVENDRSYALIWQRVDPSNRQYRVDKLDDLYGDLLVDRVGAGAYFASCTVSHNGRYLGGTYYNPQTQRFEGFVLDTKCTLEADINGDGRVDDADLLQVLFNFGSSCGGN